MLMSWSDRVLFEIRSRRERLKEKRNAVVVPSGARSETEALDTLSPKNAMVRPPDIVAAVMHATGMSSTEVIAAALGYPKYGDHRDQLEVQTHHSDWLMGYTDPQVFAWCERRLNEERRNGPGCSS